MINAISSVFQKTDDCFYEHQDRHMERQMAMEREMRANEFKQQMEMMRLMMSSFSQPAMPGYGAGTSLYPSNYHSRAENHGLLMLSGTRTSQHLCCMPHSSLYLVMFFFKYNLLMLGMNLHVHSFSI
jgi:ornithine cyclodeaminase/alanine dehydrogenase-like protein (mu-crystallin family)